MYKLWDFKDHRVQSLIFKVTEMCNLGCDYCYRQNIERERAVMSFTTIENSIKNFSNWILTHFDKSREMNLIWHGGEPLICGLDYYLDIYRIIEAYAEKGFKFYTAFQTNGTLINSAWIELFKKYKVGIGISIDGDAHTNDFHRKRVDGRSCFKSIMKGIEVLRKHNYPFSGIAVVTNEGVGYLKDNLDFFVEHGFETVDFIPSYLWNSHVTLKDSLYQQGLVELYDYWKEKYPSKIQIRFLSDIEKKIKNEAQCVGCEIAGYCGENFSINVKGDVFPCETLSTYKELLIGNVNQTRSFDQMINSETFGVWKNRVNAVDSFCCPGSEEKCSVQEICKGGCFNRRYAGDKNMSRDYFCDARYNIISHIRDRTRVDT